MGPYQELDIKSTFFREFNTGNDSRAEQQILLFMRFGVLKAFDRSWEGVSESGVDSKRVKFEGE